MSVQKEPILLITDALIVLLIVPLVVHVVLKDSNVHHVHLIDSFIIKIVFHLALKKCSKMEPLVEVVMLVA